MASTIKIKRSGVAGKVPTTSDIAVGELAINTKDQKLYSSNGTAVFQIAATAAGGVSITTATVKNLTQNDTVVTNVSSYANSVVDNSMLATKASWSALTSTNTALRTLISDRLQVANAAATYQTKAVERAALANTNASIATQATRVTLVNTNLTGTNTALRTLISDRLQVANAATIYQTKAVERAALANTNASIATQAARITLVNQNLTATNTAIRALVSDRLQVANASSLYATKASPTTSGVLAHTGRATISTNLTVSGNTTVSGTLSTNNLTAKQVGGDEGGQIDFELAATNTTLNSGVAIDIYRNQLRIFEKGGTNRGAYIDLTAATAGIGSNLLAGGGTSGATWAALTSTNTALRTLISDRLQVANAAAIYQTKAVERAALANTNASITTQASRITLVNTNLTGTNTALRTLISDRLQVANASSIYQTKAVERAALANTNSYIAAQASRITLVNTNLTGTNTALRTLISDRLQVANAVATYATKASPTTSGVLAHTGRATISTNLTVSGNTTSLNTFVTNLYPTNYFELISSRAVGSHGHVGLFRTTQSATSNFIPFSFESDYGNHSWGTIARIRMGNSGGGDRPSIQFSTAYNDTRWSIGYCSGSDDNFRITQNLGIRNDGVNNDGFGTQRLTIDTNGVVNLYGGNGGAQLNLQNGGDLVIYDATNTYLATIWSDAPVTGMAAANYVHFERWNSNHQRCGYDRGWDNYPSITVRNDTTNGPQGEFRIHGASGISGGDISINLRVDGGYIGSTSYLSFIYDLNDTAYYCDPNSQSNLYRVRVGPYAGSTTNGNQTGLEIKNTDGTGDGNVAAISFHCGNYYGIHLHLRHDGYFGLGGWSSGAWRWYSAPNGDMIASGNVIAYSDPRLKEEIQAIESPLQKITQLNGVRFRWKDTSIIGNPGGYDYGILANEVETVMPELVVDTVHDAPEGDKYKGVAYDKLVALLIEGIKEQQKQIEELKDQIGMLRGTK